MQEKELTVRFLDQKYSARYVKTVKETAKALEYLMGRDVLMGLDTETCAKIGCENYDKPGLSPIYGEIRLLQIFDGINSFLFDWRYLDPELFREFLETKRFIAHNALFDLGMLKAKGIHKINIGCTFIAAKLLQHAKYPTDTGLGAKLSELVKMVFKEDILKVLQLSDWFKDDLTFEQIEYAALDAICVLKLAEKFAPAIESKKLTKIYALLKNVQHPVAEMQLNGIAFNTEKHKNLVEKWRKEMLAARSIALQETGLEEITSNKVSKWLEKTLSKELLNIWPRTPGGALSTDKNAFKEFAHIKQLAPLMEFNKYETLLSTFGPKLLTFINPVTKKIHPSYNILGARTGRWSSRNPNFQNQPSQRTEASFRDVFISDPEYSLVAADYSQIEVRVAAEVSGDEVMKTIYRNGLDIYRETAKMVLNKPTISDLERQQMKAVVLGRLFGLGAAKFGVYAKTQYGLEITEDEAEEFIDGFKSAYPTFTQWQYDQGARCERSLIATTTFGKLRKLDKKAYYGAGLNQPIQGDAATIMECGLVRYYESKHKNFLLITSIHDELVTMVPDSQVEEGKSLLESCMVAGFLDVFPKGITTGLVKATAGKTLGECK